MRTSVGKRPTWVRSLVSAICFFLSSSLVVNLPFAEGIGGAIAQEADPSPSPSGSTPDGPEAGTPSPEGASSTPSPTQGPEDSQDPEATESDLGENIYPQSVLANSMGIERPLSGDSVQVQDVSSFDPDGGVLLLDRGTTRFEPIAYGSSDPSTNSFLDINRVLPSEHPAGASVAAAPPEIVQWLGCALSNLKDVTRYCGNPPGGVPDVDELVDELCDNFGSMICDFPPDPCAQLIDCDIDVDPTIPPPCDLLDCEVENPCETIDCEPDVRDPCERIDCTAPPPCDVAPCRPDPCDYIDCNTDPCDYANDCNVPDPCDYVDCDWDPCSLANDCAIPDPCDYSVCDLDPTIPPLSPCEVFGCQPSVPVAPCSSCPSPPTVIPPSYCDGCLPSLLQEPCVIQTCMDIKNESAIARSGEVITLLDTDSSGSRSELPATGLDLTASIDTSVVQLSEGPIEDAGCADSGQGGIIGCDDRRRVDETRYPYSAVGQLVTEFPNGQVGACTGFLISKTVVLTAGHCVYRPGRGGFATGVFASFMRDPQATLGFRHHCSERQIYASTSWVNDQDPYFDWGAVVLSCNTGSRTGYFGFEGANNQQGRLSILSSYPGDKNETQWYTLKEIRNTSDFPHSGEIDFYRHDVVGGSSGGVVFAAGPSAIGIHTAARCKGPNTDNCGANISEDRFLIFRRLRRQWG